VALGALAFLSAGHMPDRGRYGDNVRRALDYIISNAKPSGLINISTENRDMYNHGLAMFVLTQAYGMINDQRIARVVDKGIRLICDVQSEAGGWDYVAVRKSRGHDLSLAVMQAKALRSAMDIGLDIPADNVTRAISAVRSRYSPYGEPDGRSFGSDPLSRRPGAFTYNGGQSASTAMAAAGAVCLQEFGEYTDFRVQRSMERVALDIKDKMETKDNTLPFDGYAMYYVAQGLYQVGGNTWRDNYPVIRDAIVKTQNKSGSAGEKGSWEGGKVGGKPGKLFGTSVAVFALTIPNRYLPILQKGEAQPGQSGKR
jgi:hypothetical protein